MKRGKREGELYGCQEGGMCDRLRAVPNGGAWRLLEFLPPDPCVCCKPIEPIESDAHVQRTSVDMSSKRKGKFSSSGGRKKK